MKLSKFGFVKKEKVQQIENDYHGVCTLYCSVMSRINKFEEEMRDYAGLQMVFASKAKEFFDDIADITEVKEQTNES